MVWLLTFTKEGKNLKKRALFALLLCVFFLWGCGSVQEVSQVQPTATATIQPLPTREPSPTSVPVAATTAPSPAITPTATLPATPTPVLAHPTLGETIQAWDSYYTPMDVSTTQEKMHAYIVKNVTPALYIVVGFDPMQNNRVFTVTVRLNSNAPWLRSNQQSLDNVLLFIPLRSWPESQIETDKGTDLQWHDNQLGQEFAPYNFIDNNGKGVTAGSFNIFYLYTSVKKNIVSHATISLGDVYGL